MELTEYRKRMVEAAERQATALERIAGVAEDVEQPQIDPPPAEEERPTMLVTVNDLSGLKYSLREVKAMVSNNPEKQVKARMGIRGKTVPERTNVETGDKLEICMVVTPSHSGPHYEVVYINGIYVNEEVPLYIGKAYVD